MQRTNNLSIKLFLLIGFFLLFKNSDATLSGWNLTGLSTTVTNGAAEVTTTFPENLTAGQPTGIKITAKSDAVVSYFILSQPEEGMFSINTLTGAVTFVKGVLDFEKTQKYLIRVRASDTAGNGTANVTLNVGNSPPAFPPTTYSKEMCDGAKAGTTVTTVKAEDPGKTAVKYALTGTNNFTINGTTGVIKVDTAKTLNMTVKNSHILEVTASDTATTPAVGTATVSVSVIVCSGGTSAIVIAYGALLLSIIVNRL